MYILYVRKRSPFMIYSIKDLRDPFLVRFKSAHKLAIENVN